MKKSRHRGSPSARRSDPVRSYIETTITSEVSMKVDGGSRSRIGNRPHRRPAGTSLDVASYTVSALRMPQSARCRPYKSLRPEFGARFVVNFPRRAHERIRHPAIEHRNCRRRSCRAGPSRLRHSVAGPEARGTGSAAARGSRARGQIGACGWRSDGRRSRGRHHRRRGGRPGGCGGGCHAGCRCPRAGRRCRWHPGEPRGFAQRRTTGPRPSGAPVCLRSALYATSPRASRSDPVRSYIETTVTSEVCCASIWLEASLVRSYIETTVTSEVSVNVDSRLLTKAGITATSACGMTTVGEKGRALRDARHRRGGVHVLARRRDERAAGKDQARSGGADRASAALLGEDDDGVQRDQGGVDGAGEGGGEGGAG